MECKMNVLILLAVVAASVTAKPFNQQADPEDSAGFGMYDGQKTTIEKHPYLVGVHYQGDFICAGAIISNSWVLTVGGCPDNYFTFDLSVLAGSDEGNNGQEYEVSKVVQHPKYDPYRKHYWDYDYALIRIKGKFKWNNKTKPTKLPEGQPAVNTTMVVAGWGDTGSAELGVGANTLRQGNMTWMNGDVCKPFFKNFPWTDRMGCLFNQNKTTLCEGDWGDGFIYNDTIYGVYIGAAGPYYCTSKAPPVIAANVATVTPWIKKVIGAKYEDDLEDFN